MERLKNEKSFFLATFVFASLINCLMAQTATIKVAIERPIGDIDPKIYGVFMEPIHFSRPMPGQEEIVSGNTLFG